MPRRSGITRRAGRLLAAAAALAFVGVVGWLLRRAPASSPPPPRVIQLTSYPGTEVAPSFSPDGTQVAFSWNGETRDNSDIYVKLIGSSGPPLRLTTHPATDNFPAWSPDGRHIAFRRTNPPPGVAGPRHVNVYVLPALGGPERKVADVPYVRFPFLSWTPDGKWLAAPGVDPPGGNGIFLFPVEEGEERRLTSNTADVDSCPALSPDGRFLAYASCSAIYTCDVHVLELDTDHRPKGAPRRLTREGFVISGIAWSAEGRDLVYSASREGANAPYLWRIAASGGGTPERIEVAGTPAANPTVSRFGHRLAYTRGTTDDDIWKVEAGKPTEPLILSTRSDRSPHFSPDGKRIAFCSDRGTAALEIFVANADGTQPIQLTDALGREQCSPKWSPDGRRIVFDSQAADGTWDILVIDAAGGPPRRLAPGPSSENLPSWSSDGRWVYFTSDRSGRPEAWRVAAEGGEPARITDAGGVTSLESTDGRTLYYVKKRTPAQPLFARPIGGGAERQIVNEILGRTFAVAKDGVYYFARTETAGAASLRHLDVATGRSREITRVDRLPSLGVTVSPDRKTILFGAFKPPDNDLLLIESFR